MFKVTFTLEDTDGFLSLDMKSEVNGKCTKSEEKAAISIVSIFQETYGNLCKKIGESFNFIQSVESKNIGGGKKSIVINRLPKGDTDE